MKTSKWRLIYGHQRRPKGPWRSTREGAILDAIDQGFARRDEHDADRLWWEPLVEIEERGE